MTVKARLLLVVAAIAALAGCVGPGSKENSGTPASVASAPLRVAVFVDNGARNVGAFRWLEITARMKNAVATPVDGEAVRNGALDSADVLVMPGGSSVDEAKSLEAAGREKVKAFVKAGGGYVGTCAGCCLLMEPSKDHPDMLHMIPFKFGPSGGRADLSISFNRRAEELAGIKKAKVPIRYSWGPVPLPSLPVEDSDVEVIATYNGNLNAINDSARPSMAGQAAAFAGTYGKGRRFVLSVHPEYDPDDHFVLQGAFRFVTGRELEWDYPQRKRSQLAVGFMCDDSFGAEVARLVQRLVTEDEFDILPLNSAAVSEGWLHHVDAVLAPSFAARAKPAAGLYGKNSERTKAFLARGGRIFAWGRAAEEAGKHDEIGTTCVGSAEDALAALRAFAAEPVPPRSPFPAKVEKPLVAGIFQDDGSSSVPFAGMLALSPEYELRFLGPKDYANGGLDGLDLVIQSGNARAMQYDAIGEKGAEALKQFVLGGGKYYGVCAGAFLALQPSLPERRGLGLVPFKDDAPAHCRGVAPIKVKFSEAGKGVFEVSSTNRVVAYANGPALVPGDSVEDSDIKVLGRYLGRTVNICQPEPLPEMKDKAAFVGGRVGKGMVFLSCPHPEFEEGNFDLVRNGIKLLTGVAPSGTWVDRMRGAVSVKYVSSDKASVQFLFGPLLRDSRIDVLPAKEGWEELPHVDAVVLTADVSNGDVSYLTTFIRRGGRVVVVADTEQGRQAAGKLAGAVVVDSYDKVIAAILN